ncbi:FAD-binding oxidoreductase [Paraglaciecola hydrolytica]|uniref:FAD-binding protein n=1 Tax=Paraglaciecola hydrolytica TaxID=1799789 RepID=A0A135ZZU2_9ALTE|nr:FAD-binding protein [Paraglaciecola hydrolytica]KXI28519.1 FAD-binding protein [Paraglaciecola hydrolytica]
MLSELLTTELDNKKVLILDTAAASQNYGQTTFSPQLVIDAAVIVLDESVIGKLLTLANRYSFCIYPISSGKNWGYGSFQFQSSSKPKVVLDLSKLKKITSTDKKLGLITLQPGVTQQDLYEFLSKNNWPYMTPVTGAGPSCSIVSNALERGYGITPRTDHFAAVNALKAYIPHPEHCETRYESAISALDSSKEDFIDKTFKWGLGPYLDGIFSQSNLGIVSEMTIRLAPLPKNFCSFYIKVPNHSNFPNAIELIRDTLQQFEGTVGSINLMDRRRLVSMTSKNPNGPATHATMTEQQVLQLAKSNQLPEWMIVGSIYGDSKIVQATKKFILKRANNLGTVYFSDSLLMKFVNRVLSLPLPQIEILTTLREQMKSLQEGTDIMLGKPNQIALPLAYWRNPRVFPDKSILLNPAKDGCGLLWYAPLIPMKTASLENFIQFVRTICPKYQIEPLITFTNLRHDCIDATVPIVFNLEDKDACDAAHSCLNELINAGLEFGFVPYRLNTGQQQKMDFKPVFWQTVKLIKESLDPNNILHPGRYSPHNIKS